MQQLRMGGVGRRSHCVRLLARSDSEGLLGSVRRSAVATDSSVHQEKPAPGGESVKQMKKNGHKVAIAAAVGDDGGTWHAVANHTGHSVPVPGFARDDGYKAKLKGAELLSVKPEHVRVEWVRKDERRA